MRFIRLALSCALVIAWSRADHGVELEIPQGFLKGIKLTTVLQNKPYFSFKGIPYAKPNIGRNKFQVRQSPRVIT
jgi:carboxylesterase type B